MIKIKLNSLYKVLLFSFLFIIVGRGFFELFFEKKTAFLIQVFAILTFIFFGLSFYKLRVNLKYLYLQVLIFLTFTFISIVSIMLTIYFDNGGAPIFYTLIMLFLLACYILISSFNVKFNKELNIGNMLLILILLLVSTALYEQLTNFLMPGAWWYHGKVRPSSLTGSKQHYSIILSILTLYIFQYWVSLKRKKYLLGFFVGILGVVLSLTRSGAMILVLALFPYFIYNSFYTRTIKINRRVLITVLLLLLFFSVFAIFYFDINFFLERIISSISTTSPGNDERIVAWLLGIKMLFNTNLLFGEYTGLVTNAVRTVTSADSFVVESGVLQMILNYGFLGFFAFYLSLGILYVRIGKDHKTLLFSFFACLISTTVYQSIETIPFIVLLSLIPLISNDIKLSSEKRKG